MNVAARRRWGIGALLGAGALAALVWLASATRWEDVEIPRAPSGKAAADEHYALQRLAQDLGARTVARERLEPFPPAGATLLLGSWSWDTFPERDRALRSWVEHGGQLIMGYWSVASPLRGPRGAAGAAPEGAAPGDAREWIPVRLGEFKPEPRRPAAPPGKPAARDGPAAPAQTPPKDRATRTSALLPKPVCRTLHEIPGATPAYGADAQLPGAPAPAGAAADAPESPGADDVRLAPEPITTDDGPAPAAGPGAGLRLCSFGLYGPGLVARAPVWGLGDRSGLRLVRVAVGAGSVTIVQDPNIFENAALLQGDNGLIDAAALQLRAGTELWLVEGDGRAQILAWIWARAPLAVLGGALALLCWLWRSVPRFGPRAEAAPLARRSMIEQIRGTALFLWRRDPPALHAAQRRALDEAAARRIRDYARLDLSDRAEAIARATGLAGTALLQALAIDRPPDRRSLPRQLAVLESARRALLREAPVIPPVSRSKHR